MGARRLMLPGCSQLQGDCFRVLYIDTLYSFLGRNGGGAISMTTPLINKLAQFRDQWFPKADNSVKEQVLSNQESSVNLAGPRSIFKFKQKEQSS